MPRLILAREPGGSWRETCRTVSYGPDRWSVECRDRAGNLVPNDVPRPAAGALCSNDDGRIVCSDGTRTRGTTPRAQGIELEGLGPFAGKLVPLSGIRGPVPRLPFRAPFAHLVDVWGHDWLVHTGPYYWDQWFNPHDRAGTGGEQREALALFEAYARAVMNVNGWVPPTGDPVQTGRPFVSPKSGELEQVDLVKWKRLYEFAGRDASRIAEGGDNDGPWCRHISFDLAIQLPGARNEWWLGWVSAVGNYWTRTAVLTRIEGVDYNRMRWEVAQAFFDGLLGGAINGASGLSSTGAYGAIIGAIIGAVIGGIGTTIDAVGDLPLTGQALNRALTEWDGTPPKKPSGGGGGAASSLQNLTPQQKQAGLAFGGAALLALL